MGKSGYVYCTEEFVAQKIQQLQRHLADAEVTAVGEEESQKNQRSRIRVQTLQLVAVHEGTHVDDCFEAGVTHWKENEKMFFLVFFF